MPGALAALLATGKAAFKFVATSEAELDEVQAIVDAHQLDPVWVMPEGVPPPPSSTEDGPSPTPWRPVAGT